MAPAKKKFDIDSFKKWYDTTAITTGGIIAAFVLSAVLSMNEKYAVHDEKLKTFESRMASFERGTDLIKMDMKESHGEMEAMKQVIIKMQAVLPKQDQFDIK